MIETRRVRDLDMGSLLVVSGPPGAGKSTVAQILANRTTPSALVEGDEFFRFLRNGMIEPWKVESRDQNEVITRIQATSAAQYRDGGYETVYDGVLGPWFVETFASAVGGSFDYAVLLPSVDSCLHRIGTRVGHSFDDEQATRSLHQQFVDGCAAFGVDAHHVIDNSNGSAESVVDEIVARRSRGLLAIG